MINVDSFIQAIGDRPLPPVEQWDPDYCGELDIFIKADGSWLYNGTPLTRHKMKILFSRVIKKEGEQYFLVTPVEKVAIKVEWQPFTIIDFDKVKINGKTVFNFIDGCDNKVELTNLSQLKLSEFSSKDQPAQLLPIIQIRRNLFAGFSRSCYYRLLEETKNIQRGEQNQVILYSNDIPFCLGHF